jgi:hypothetical protein
LADRSWSRTAPTAAGSAIRIQFAGDHDANSFDDDVSTGATARGVDYGSGRWSESTLSTASNRVDRAPNRDLSSTGNEQESATTTTTTSQSSGAVV